jgi:hypothetical protein
MIASSRVANRSAIIASARSSINEVVSPDDLLRLGYRMLAMLLSRTSAILFRNKVQMSYAIRFIIEAVESIDGIKPPAFSQNS